MASLGNPTQYASGADDGKAVSAQAMGGRTGCSGTGLLRPSARVAGNVA